jgi:putative redox protein
MAQAKSVVARLDGELRFAVRTGSGHALRMDGGDEIGGGQAGATPMELVLVGLAGCAGMDVISILRKMRQDVTGYELRVRAEQAETHPRVYTAITVEHHIAGHALVEALVRRAVELSHGRYCPVGAMLGRTAAITHEVYLAEAETRPGEG